MDSNILKTLGLDSKMSPNDLNLLNQILGSAMNGNKSQKISISEKNNLISKLSSATTLANLPQKEMKEMNEQEKKIYKEELKKRLKNKQSEKKMLRTNNIGKNKNNYNDTLNKLNDMMKNIPNDVLEQKNNDEQQNNDEQKNNDTKANTHVNIDQTNKINDIINKNYKNTDDLDTSNQLENFDDYIN
jgi:hypothetical protein